jgi:hypothetical protein
MKKHEDYLVLIFSVMVMIGAVGCGQEAPKTEAPSKSVTDSTGQAIVDSIKTPMDKARQVENKLEKAAERTSDAVKDATQ